MLAVILAGGKGTRLRSVVSDVPKPMAPIAGKPFVEILMSSLVAKGVGEIVLSVGHMRHTIINYFSDSFQGVPVSYAIEEKPLGTGGAILNAVQGLDHDKEIFILNGDTFLDFNPQEMREMYLKTNAEICVALKPMADSSRYGRVILDEKKEHILEFTEKGDKVSGVINAGVYLLRPSFFASFDFGPVFSLESDCFEKYVDTINFLPYIVDGYFIDIGVPDDYRKAQIDFADT